jgi:RNA polymerase sigma factor (sigma-70 family)
MEVFLGAPNMTARDGAGFVSWLHRIAEHNLRDAIKELERKKRPSPALRVAVGTSSDSYAALIGLLGTTSSTPSRQVARQEACAAIDAALARMPPDYAKVIRLYDLDERDIEAVAAELGRSTGAVYMLRARAHDLLRTLLGDETDFFTRTA